MRERKLLPRVEDAGETFLRCMALSDLAHAPNILVDEPSKALYRATFKRLLQQKGDKLERDRGALDW